jgi:amino acid transporter
MMLYADAFVSPSGTGTTYTATTSRMIYGMQRNGTLPAILGKVDPRSGVPRPAMWFNLAVSFIFLVKFPGWDQLAEVISVATIVTYLVGPVAVMTLAFVLATLMLYWARWPETGEIMFLLILPLPVYFYYVARGGWADFARHLRAAWWLVVYLAAVAGLSCIGSTQFGGLGYLPYGWDQLCVVAAALLFYWWGLRSGWRTPALEAAESASTDV